MGRQELDEVLAAVRVAASAEQIASHFPAVHQALADIERKRGLFLETAFGCVRRALWSLLRGESASEDEGVEGDGEEVSLAQAVALALEFVHPLALQADGSATKWQTDRIREVCCSLRGFVLAGYDVSTLTGVVNEEQRGVVAAMGLHLLGVLAEGSVFAARHHQLRARLVSIVSASDIDMHVLLATMRFREELATCRRALMPSFESDSESEDDVFRDNEEGNEEGDEEGEDDQETRRDDLQWIAHAVAKSWGLSDFVYFLSDSGQEFGFAAWSSRGIGIFAFSIFVERMTVDGLVAPPFAPIISPPSALFLASAYAHAMIVSDENEARVRGLKLVHTFTIRCREHDLACSTDTPTGASSFRDLETRFRRRNWIDVIVQAMTGAMVSFPEATDRSNALSVLRALISILNLNDRFWLMKDLALKCPYANVSAVLVDCVRSDVVAVWRSEEMALLTSPYTSKAVVEFVNGILAQAAERDLVLHADLIASCLSLYRFLHIRDKEDRTSIHKDNQAAFAVFSRIQRRLQQKLDEDVPMEQATEHHTHASTDTGLSSHLFLLEAALSSTLSLLEPSQGR